MFIIQAIGHPVHWLKMAGKIEIETYFENSSTSRAMMASIPTLPKPNSRSVLKANLHRKFCKNYKFVTNLPV